MTAECDHSPSFGLWVYTGGFGSARGVKAETPRAFAGSAQIGFEKFVPKHGLQAKEAALEAALRLDKPLSRTV